MLAWEVTLSLLGTAVGGAVLVVIGLRLSGRHVGPSRDFARALVPRPVALPPPPSPHRNRWQPWFRLWGPAWLDIRQGLATEPGFWPGYEHARMAYRAYLEDRLPECIAAAEKALSCGTRPRSWPARMVCAASVELEAREQAVRVARSPFVYELPADDRQYDSLMDVAEACHARMDALLWFRPRWVTVTLLHEQSIPRDAGSQWGYLALKAPWAKLCLLHPPDGGLAEASLGLVSEYVRLAAHTVSVGRAPTWLTQGLIEWAVAELLRQPLPPSTPAVCGQPLGASQRLLQAALGCSPLERLALAEGGAGRVVARLLASHQEGALRRFVESLATQSEESAFRRAFGRSEAAFEESIANQ